MNTLQQRLLNLLVEFDIICEKNNIDYFLAAGAALGAVRNGGFLPWDDDIDLYITRSNWNKLRSVMSSSLPENRFFASYESTPYYLNPVGRYGEKESTLIFKSQIVCQEACGIHLELFIFDPIPSEKKKRTKYLKNLKVYTELMNPYFVNNIFNPLSDEYFSLKRYWLFYYLSRIIGKKNVLRFLEKKLFNYSYEDCDQLCMRWGVKIYIYDKYLFDSKKNILFEGINFPTHKKVEQVLRLAYGDSWVLIPDSDSQISHNSIIDFDIPFKKFFLSISGSIDRRHKLFNIYKKNKLNNMKSIVYKEKFNKSIAHNKSKILNKYLNNFYNEKINTIVNLTNKREYKELDPIFATYISTQFDKTYLNLSIYFDLGEKFAIALLNYLINYFNYSLGVQFLKLLDRNNSIRKEIYQNWNDVLLLNRNLEKMMYDEPNPEGISDLISSYDRSDFNIYMYRAILYSYNCIAKKNSEWQNIIDIALEALNFFKDDGEINYYKILASFRVGISRESIVQQINVQIKNTRNGLIIERYKSFLSELNGADNG